MPPHLELQEHLELLAGFAQGRPTDPLKAILQSAVLRQADPCQNYAQSTGHGWGTKINFAQASAAQAIRLKQLALADASQKRLRRVKESHRSWTLQTAQLLPLQQQKVQVAPPLSLLPWSPRLHGAAQASHHALQPYLKHRSRAMHHGMQAHCQLWRACCCHLA